MVLVIDNYDSFTYNLVQYLGELGVTPMVRRNDQITVEDLVELAPSRIVISPGPGRPEQAGIAVAAIRRLGPEIPILGVCLGHQAIGQAFGAEIESAPVLFHGKQSLVKHNGRDIFAGLRDPFEAARYHSLVVKAESSPSELEITARVVDEETVMGLRHRRFRVYGVQFHPESILTGVGHKLLQNFLEC